MWGKQDSGVGEHPEIIAAGGNETRKSTSAAANKVEAGGRHGEMSGVRERVAERWETPAGKPPGVGIEVGGRKANGVAGDPSGVGGEEGGHEAYGLGEDPRRDRQGVRGVV